MKAFVDGCFEQLVADVVAFGGRVDKILGDGRVWPVGDRYSVVDPYLLVFYLWGARVGVDMLRHYPAWSGHARLVTARPAAVRAFAQEEIECPFDCPDAGADPQKQNGRR